MRELLTQPSGRYHLLAWLEGASLVLLVLVAMPLKYFAGLPEATRVVGLAHGLLFIAFMFSLFERIGAGTLSGRDGWKAFAASLVPFGTFLFLPKPREPEDASPASSI